MRGEPSRAVRAALGGDGDEPEQMNHPLSLMDYREEKSGIPTRKRSPLHLSM